MTVRTLTARGKSVGTLLRLRLSLAVAASSLAGFVCCANPVDSRALFAAVGVFLLSCSASALNQYQERESDALMERTRRRPLPMRQIRARAVLAIATGTCLAGTATLFFFAAPLAAGLGVIAAGWYNAVYTPLKRTTRFAVLAGAVSGSLPPLIGCAAAGGPLSESCIVFSLLMYLWQMLHCAALQARYREDYERAGIPLICSCASRTCRPIRLRSR